VASTQVLAQGGEFQVNTYTPNAQQRPVIAADASGNFVVVWQTHDSGGTPTEVIGRRFSSAGSPASGEFQINAFTTGKQSRPAVARSGAGGFVVVWASDAQDGDSYGIFGRRFDAAGNPVAAEFQINSFTTGSQFRPWIAMRTGGDFVVVWGSFGQDGSGYGSFGRRFDSSGTALAVEFQINEYTTSDQGVTSVAVKGDGGFVVTWNSGGQDGDSGGVFARFFDSAGAPTTGDFQVNAYTVGAQAASTVTWDQEGSSIGVAWQSMDQDGAGLGVFARGFDSTGVPEDEGDFQINAYTTDDQGQPVPLVLGNGAFAIVWQSDTEDGSSYGIFANAIGDRGLGYETQVNTTIASLQSMPRAAATGQRFVVVWQSAGQDGSNFGVFGRRFVVPTTLDVDGDGAITALTDGLLVLRYDFGFRGATLVSSAVNLSGCTRCDAPSIEAYLGSI
jgi:hypothetical protein